MKDSIFKFVQVQDFMKSKWWMLLIENYDDLRNFAFATTDVMMDTYNYLQNKNYTGHWKTELSLAMDLAIGNVKDRKTIIDDLLAFNTAFWSPKEQLIRENKKILINSNLLGYRILDNSIEILRKKTSKKLIFPGYFQKVRVSKWINGNHYYLFDGNLQTSIMIDGKTKWNTVEDAEKALKKYKRNLNKKK